MKSPNGDDSLSRLLADWRVAPRHDPQFRAAVAARIETSRRVPAWSGYARTHAAALASALAVALVAGAMIGREQARARVAADREVIADAYVRALDARAMTRP